MPPLLGVVIITHNEAQNVDRCIQSALAAATRFPGTQIMLVDSASTDDTCALAQRYPISIVQLKPTWRLTPAAGRYIGTLRTHCDYILFLDGDMTLNVDWVKAGIEFMQTHPQAAAISGDMDEIYLDGGQPVGVLHHRYQVHDLMEVRALGGAGLYRREALDRAGTFNPFVPLREEAELALRLRRAGYRLYRLPCLIADHYSPPRQTLREIGRRYQAGYYAGFGRALYYANRNGLGWQFVREQGLAYLAFAVYVLLGLASLLCLFLGQRRYPIILWVALTAMILVAFALRKGSLREALIGFISRGLIVYGGVAGVLSAWRDPPDYPTGVSVIKP